MTWDWYQVFRHWLQKMRDKNVQVRIAARIRNAEAGNLGDSQPVGEGVSEMRIHLGAGYRLSCLMTGKAVIFLLMGGDKSAQQADINRAIAMARQIKESTHDCR